MQPGRCLFLAPVRALRSVQVPHIESSSGRSIMTAAARHTTLPTRTAVLSIRAAASATPSSPRQPSCRSPAQAACFSTTRRQQGKRYPSPQQGGAPAQNGGANWREKRALGPGKSVLPSKFARLPADKAIPFRYVRVADGAAHALPVPEDSTNGLSEPVLTRSLLADIDRSQWTLVQVSLAPAVRNLLASVAEEDGEEGDDDGSGPTARELRALRSRPKVLESPDFAPICRLLDKRAFAAVAEARAKEARKLKVGTKELELNWAIAAHDLGHKMRQMHGFLVKGRRVELLLAKKRQNRAAAAAEAKDLLRAVREAADAAGAREIKSDGNFPGPVKLVFEGGSEEAAAAKAAAKAAEAPAAAGAAV